MNPRPRRNPQYDPSRPGNARLEGRTAVYRLYSKTDELLYVGISYNPEQRWRAHASNKLWWHWVVRMNVVWCDSRHAALKMEADIEHDEQPRFCDLDLMGGYRTQEPDEELEAELSALAVTLRGEIERGLYSEKRGVERPSRYARQYSTSNTMFVFALIRAQKEFRAGREPVETNKPMAPPASWWMDDLSDPLR